MMVSWSGKLRQIMALMHSCGASPKSLEHDGGLVKLVDAGGVEREEVAACPNRLSIPRAAFLPIRASNGCRALGFVGEDVAHRLGGAPRRGVVVVGVSLESERRAGVPGEGLEVPNWFAALGEERQAAMPEVVESDGGEARSLQKRFVVAVHDVLGVQRLALSGCEHEAAVLVQRTCSQFLL